MKNQMKTKAVNPFKVERDRALAGARQEIMALNTKADKAKIQNENLEREIKLLEADLKKAQEERNQKESLAWDLAHSLSHRLDQLRSIGSGWRRYLAAKEIGAPAEMVEELRGEAHGLLVSVMGMDLNEAALQRIHAATMGECGMSPMMAGAQAVGRSGVGKNIYRGAH